MRPSALIRALVLTGAVLAAAAPAAPAQSGPQGAGMLAVLADFAPDRTLDPCAHSLADLRAALNVDPSQLGRYADEFPTAVQDAIEARARGDCKGKDAGGSAAPGATATPAPSPTTPPATPVPTPTPAAAAPAASPTPTPSATSTGGGSGAAIAVLVAGVLAGALALALLAFVAARRLGVADDRLAPVDHALREARWRAGGTWADFRDWVRTGR